VLVVLDNASDAKQVRPLLPGEWSRTRWAACTARDVFPIPPTPVIRPGCAALVTSHNHLPGLPAPRLLDLKMLDCADARALLERIVGPGRAAAKPNAMTGVIAACAGLPLASGLPGPGRPSGQSAHWPADSPTTGVAWPS
jgi:hypothetical protein